MWLWLQIGANPNEPLVVPPNGQIIPKTNQYQNPKVKTPNTEKRRQWLRIGANPNEPLVVSPKSSPNQNISQPSENPQHPNEANLIQL